MPHFRASFKLVWTVPSPWGEGEGKNLSKGHTALTPALSQRERGQRFGR